MMRAAFVAPADVLVDEGANLNLLASELHRLGYVISRVVDEQALDAFKSNDVCFVFYPGLGISTAVLDGADEYVEAFRARISGMDTSRMFFLNLPRGLDAVRIVAALGALGGLDTLDLWVGLHPQLLKQGPAYQSSLIGDRATLEAAGSFELIDGEYGRAPTNEQRPLVSFLDSYLRKHLESSVVRP